MSFAKAFLWVAVAGFCGSAAAQTIFNIQPPQPQTTQQSGQQSSSVQVARPAPVPLPASPMPIYPVGTKATAQFDQLPNESIEAYQIRMNALSQRAFADMERVSREHKERMKALTPK